jgi:hypothetical protein
MERLKYGSVEVERKTKPGAAVEERFVRVDVFRRCRIILGFCPAPKWRTRMSIAAQEPDKTQFEPADELPLVRRIGTFGLLQRAWSTDTMTSCFAEDQLDQPCPLHSALPILTAILLYVSRYGEISDLWNTLLLRHTDITLRHYPI